MISSSTNPRVKELVKLRNSSRFRTEKERFVIEGFKMFGEAKELGLVENAYVSEEQLSDRPDISGLLEGSVWEPVSEAVFKKMADTVTPQGILAVVRMPQFSPDELLTEGKSDLLFLEEIKDPGNLGTMIRTAEAAGIKGIIVSKGTADVYNPKTVRSTMGSVFRLPVVRTDFFMQTLKEAKKQDITLFAASLTAEVCYDDVDYTKGRCGILIGNEANGLTGESIRLCDIPVKIPMNGRAESLNAAVASAVMMYEINRQKRRCQP